MATIKQEKAINNLVENGGNVTKAMRDAGYAESTINNPSNLTKSDAYKSFKELADVYLPDDMLLGALAEDIEVKKGNRTPELTLAMKVKGKMEQKVDVTSNGQTIVVMPPEIIERLDDTDTPFETE